MEINVTREILTDETTIGRLYLNGKWWCYTLEDKTRDVKIYGETCIPCGRYQIEMMYWPKHKGWYPHLRNVPQFSGILIHKGNTKADTLGCILVGMDRSGDRISNCAQAFDPLRDRITESLTNEEVWIEISRAQNAEDKRTGTT